MIITFSEDRDVDIIDLSVRFLPNKLLRLVKKK